MAMRDSAACGSPCDPVQMHTTSCARVVAARRCRGSARRPESAGSRAAARSRELSTMPRPTNATLPIELRGQVDEDLHPVDARRERRDDDACPVALVKISSKASTTSQLRAGERRADRRWCCRRSSASTPCGAELGEAMEVEVLAVERRLVDLEVAGVHDARRRGVWIASATQSGMLCVTRRNSIVNGPTCDALARLDRLAGGRGGRCSCSSSLGSTSASVSGDP